MLKKSVLSFNNYTVNKLIFTTNDASVEDELELIPIFKKNIVKCSDNKYDVSLSFSLETINTSIIPFTIEIALTGHFEFDGSENSDSKFKMDLINKNAVAILFPFLRTIIATLTTCANITPLILPIINLADFSEK